MEHSKNDEVRSIRILIHISFILLLLHYGLFLFVNIMQKPLVELLSGISEYQPIIDWAYVIGVTLTTLIFMTLILFFYYKLKTDSESTVSFGILLGVSMFFAIFIIPNLASFIGNYFFTIKLSLGEITDETYAARIAISNANSIVSFLSFPMVILLFSAYSMYCFRVKYCLNKLNEEYASEYIGDN